ncbi:UvrD-helicase domain-containing protein [Roseovarius sp. SCSIO 43702]|uniref:ATP-dependent helicase n=1 Tax=Roseovarius sp. SCSIO 43702 TaxID=2823043 RepID=UPI001C7358C6|nr:UvrD-helicase domain-containing protein [Roseovarius sp. SCSIO 43702]QYX58298.1 UvrD-helicase domain-containing protein [Roseovarius sp. SCSIO 43702]
MSDFSDSDAFEGASLSARAMAARPMPYLDDLNPAQREAVERLDGPVLMLAGAGTGKTKALTSRIAHLLNTGAARPNEILAVTFTNKAAREMKTRVGRHLGEAVEGMPWLGTFHSICVKLLRRHAELVGLKSNFTILDTDDQLRLLKQLVQAAGIDDKRWPARQLAGIIDHWKNRAWTPDKVPASEASAYDGKAVALYTLYQTRLRELNAVDFGDLLLHMVVIFQTHEDVLAQYQRWFRYILVDEYQDTNVAQYMWLRLLAAAHRNICCVGDDDQSIYGWRGAEVGNILRFEKDFPGAHVVRLEQNYRSTEHILAAAGGVISANKGRLGKELWTDAQGGEKVRLIGHWDGEEEARWIGEEIEAMQAGTRGMRAFGLDEIAILVRASHQMRAFEDRFLTIGMAYRVIGGPRFYERMEIRDAMAYFRLVVSPADDLAFERIVNTPKRGLGDKAQQTIQRIARENGVSLVDGAALAVEQGAIKGKGAQELGKLVVDLSRWGRMTGDKSLSHMELAEIILDESGYTEMWQNDKTPEAPGRLENLKELVKALEGFENLQGFLEHVSLIMDNESDEAGEKVSIMTLHAAKGLEFPAVFLPGWEDGLFPSQRSMDENGLKGVEEERRLAYVGITRAEELCTISFAGNRRVFGQWQSSLPSRFIDELPEEHVEVLTPPGLYGGGYGAAGMTSGIEERAARADAYNSPGWRRLQARAGERPLSQPRESKSSVIDMQAVSAHTVGESVFHQKFGYGRIEGIEGDKLEIAFEKAGVKKVVARFVTGADDVPF